MKIRFTFFMVWICWLAPVLVMAREPYLEFTRALRGRGYGDVAVFYLQQIASRTDTPASVREVLDLELSSSYRVWSEQTADAEQAGQWTRESQRLLEQFRSQHQRHPALPQAMLEQGELAFQRAERLWERAEQLTEVSLRAKSSTDAKQGFEESLRYFSLAADRFQQLAAALSVETALPPSAGTDGASPAAPEELQRQAQIGLVESRFKTGAAELYLSRTYSDAKSPERTAALEKAVTNFDWVYRRYPSTDVGLRALLWQAKATEELGRESDALELYNDVLLAEADATGKLTEIAAVFGQAAFWRLQLIVRLQGNEAARNEASKWLREHHAWRETGPYQGIALEGAKASLRRAENEPAKLKEKLTGEAVALIAGVAAVPGEFQNEAIRMQRERGLTKVADHSSTGGLLIGDAAMAAGQWPEAIAAYESAVESAGRNPDRSALIMARNRLNFARYRLATSLYAAGKMEESMRAAALVAKSGVNEAHAAEAASLSCFAALAIYESAEAVSQSDAGARLQRIADFTRTTWPDHPAAHDAEIVLGNWELKREKWPAAAEHFEAVPSSSPRFVTAAFYAARLYWKLCIDEKRKPPADRDEMVIKQWRDKAQMKLQTATQSSSGSDADISANRSWFDCCLLLAEIHLDGKQHQAAIELVKPLLVRFPLTSNSGDRDSFITAVHVVGLRALIASGQLDLAGSEAIALSGFGSETAAVNGALLEFVQAARSEFESSRIVIDKVRGTLQQVFEKETEDRMLRRQDSLQRVISSLAKHKQLNLQSLVFVADTCAVLGLRQSGEEVCQRILNQVDSTPGNDPKSASYATKARLQMVDLLRHQARFEEAAKHLEQLTAAHPNSLELLMKKGELLQAWATKDGKHFDDCISHWTHTRLLLSRVRPRPKEYYLVVYNTALCLIDQGNRDREPAKLRQAEQLLKSTMVMDASLDSPESVQKFKSLLTRTQSNAATSPATNRSPQ